MPDPVDYLINGPFDVAADVNEDRAVNGLDVAPFVDAILGGTQPVPEPSALALLSLTVLSLLCWGRTGR